MFNRIMVKEQDGGLARAMRNGDGPRNPIISVQAADSAQAIALNAIMGGVYQRSGMTATRIDTTPTAAVILAANPSMDIGDTFEFVVSNTTAANIVTLAGGASVTASGNLSVPAASARTFLFVKTAATTMNLIGL